ncbi:MAG: DUF4331 family protein [Abitibacteriaceae bacterium]|nr:DUF4331 family protein [Abditibacteriaceae bacterium]
MSFLRRRKQLLLVASALLAPTVFFYTRAHGSDHADTVENVQRPGADLTDVYMFPSKEDPNNVVLVMNAHPLIPAGQGGTVSFDPNVLYQFHIDNTGDGVEDMVIQAKFTGTGANQTVQIAGPTKPTSLGPVSSFLTPHATTGTLNQAFSPVAGMKVFAGPRKDPFFFDLERFVQILPDRGAPAGLTPEPSNPNAPQKTSFRGFPQTEPGAGPPKDFLANFNVLSIVIELPKSMLQRGTSGA